MPYKSLYTFLLFCLVIFVTDLQAQTMSATTDISKVKVSSMSDQDIIKYWTKFKESNIPEQEAYKMLLQRGMAPSELDLFRKRVTALGLNNSRSTTISSAKKPDINFTRDTSNIVIKPSPPVAVAKPAPAALSVYGSDFFNQGTVKFDPDFNGATPKNYVLGPGDELIVLITGLNESSVNSTITREGNLIIPRAELMYVSGYTIEQATSIIRNKLTRIYPALATGQTKLAVNLGNTRKIQVTLIGQVKVQGSYSVSSITTLPNILYLSGGPNANGSLRNIELIRNGKVIKTIDFYSFLQRGIIDGNIRLEDQDYIRFPFYTKRVGIRGEVKTPAIYELKPEEKISDLIGYAGGYTDKAYRSIAKIDRISETEKQVKDISSDLFSSVVPNNGDLIEIGSVSNTYSNRVVLEGAVVRPGPYELSAGLSLASLLKNAQGLKPEANMEKAFIYRTLPNLDVELHSFIPSDIVNGKNDIPLLRGDSIVIQDRSLIAGRQNVTINGNVRLPGSFLYRKGMKLSDIVTIAGGFTEEAASHHIDISRIIKNSGDSTANQLVRTFTINMDNTSGPAQDMELEPLDHIYVPRLVNFRPLGNIIVSGEVAFPGDYPVQKRDETALEFLQRAGGVSSYGSLENAQIFREGIRLDLDLTKASTDPFVKKSMILQPGDSIYVPRIISFVEVAGAVNNPQYISYQGRRFKYYVNSAAGATENARMKGAYVQYPNGLNKPAGTFLFFRTYPAVKPGSRIVIPEKNPDNKFRIGFAEISGIASALTALIGLIAILNK